LLLIAKFIFKERTIGFLIVKHMLENVDAHFRYLLKLMKMKNANILVDLVKAFMDFQKIVSFILEVVQAPLF
jgi:hypothetical protein